MIFRPFFMKPRKKREDSPSHTLLQTNLARALSVAWKDNRKTAHMMKRFGRMQSESVWTSRGGSAGWRGRHPEPVNPAAYSCGRLHPWAARVSPRTSVRRTGTGFHEG